MIPDGPPGFIGLGNLGGAIARRLVAAGHALHVHDSNAARMRAIEGAQSAPSPASLASRCPVVFACVSDTEAVREVVFGDDGIVAGAGACAVFVDHSTTDPDETARMAADLRSACGIEWVDAPVSGGVDGARRGTLVAMAGGEPDALGRAESVMRAYVERITHLGDSGAGQVAKLCNQVITAATVAAVAEALDLAARSGFDARRLPEALTGGFADSAVLRHHARRMLDADYAGSAGVTLKDLDMGRAFAERIGASLPVTGTVASLYRALIEAGDDDKGQAGLMCLYRREPF